MLHAKFSTEKSRLEKWNEKVTKEFLYSRIDQNPLCENYCREPQRATQYAEFTKLFSAEWYPEHILRSVTRLN